MLLSLPVKIDSLNLWIIDPRYARLLLLTL